MNAFSICINKDTFSYVTVEVNNDKYKLNDIGCEILKYKEKFLNYQDEKILINTCDIKEYITKYQIDRVFISFSDDFGEYAIIPNVTNTGGINSFKKMISLYLKEVHNADDIEDYDISYFESDIDNKSESIINIINANTTSDLANLLGIWNIAIEKKGSFFCNAVKTANFNYSNLENKKAMLVCLNDTKAISGIFNTNTIESFQILDLIDVNNSISDFIQMNNNTFEKVDYIYLAGNKLTKKIIEELKNSLSKGRLIKRLGVFDRFSHNLTQEKLDFANANFHLFASAVGAIISSKNQFIQDL